MRHCNLLKTEFQRDFLKELQAPGIALHGANMQQGPAQVLLNVSRFFAQPYRGDGRLCHPRDRAAIGLLLDAWPRRLLPLYGCWFS